MVGIEEAYRCWPPALGVGAASTLFAVALLASGQNSSITGTLAGQIVMEGFTGLRWPAWVRRLARATARHGARRWLPSSSSARRAPIGLLIFSQVVLSLQLPFAVYPLVRFTSNRRLMGRFANRPATAAVAWVLTASLIGVNVLVLVDMM